jgi:hypothetical protein
MNKSKANFSRALAVRSKSFKKIDGMICKKNMEEIELTMKNGDKKFVCAACLGTICDSDIIKLSRGRRST